MVQVIYLEEGTLKMNAHEKLSVSIYTKFRIMEEFA
jgi:hypothetical protein